MKIGSNSRKYNMRKCPRCGEKCLQTQSKCPECGLVFARLLNTSNKEGKRAVLSRQKNLVLKTNIWPDDAKRSKALILCGTLGLFGAHNYYLGKYVKAVFCSICMVICIVLCSLTTYPTWYDTVMSLFGGFLGLPLLFWVLDFVLIAIGKYKIPVAVIGSCPEKIKPTKPAKITEDLTQNVKTKKDNLDSVEDQTSEKQLQKEKTDA